MSTSSATGGSFAKYAYNPGKKSGEGRATSKFLSGGGGKDTLERKKKRRIVKDLDDDIELEVLTSPEKPRSRPNPASSASIRESDGRPGVKKLLKSSSGGGGGGGGRYGVEDRDRHGAGESRRTQSANARPARTRDARVVESDGTSSGEEDNAWFKKPSRNAGSGAVENNVAASRKPSNLPDVKVKRAKALADPGWISKSDPGNALQRQKNIQLAKAQRQKVAPRKDKVVKTGASRRHVEVESEAESVADDDEDEFESDEDSSEDDGDNDLQLTDASEGEDGVNVKSRSTPNAGNSSKRGRSSSNASSSGSYRAETGATRSAGERKGSGVRDRPVTSAGDRNGGRPSSSSSGAHPRDAHARNGFKRETNEERRNPAGNRSAGGGSSTGGVGSSAVSEGRASRVAKDSGPEKSVRLAKDSTATKLRGDKIGSSEMARNTPTDRGVVGDSTKKVKRQSGSDEAVREDVAPKKKKKVNHVREDDDLDVSDRGSDSDDDGATARRVLEECSALSKKLAAVISSWAAAEDVAGQAKGDGALKGVGSPRGAIEITQMREGKSVTTNEEISKACPGLVLNPYQLVGVNWMCLLRETGVNGVLADEMGLGKTVQTIAFFALLKHRRKGAPPRRPHLIVVPSSVLDNWDSELKKFCPSLEVVKYHGTMRDRSAIRQRLNQVAATGDREEMPDIMLTTYVMWERESCGDDRAFLKRFKYDYMVLDEGHSIKNIKSSRFQRLRIVVSKHRLLLSGTPVQNNLGELVALLSFLMPAIFRSDVIETLLEFLGDAESRSTTGVSSSSSSAAFQVREVRGMLAPFVLRRLKAAVLRQLVPKTERLEMVALSKVQRSVYDGVLEEHVRQKRAAIERALDYEKLCKTAGADGATNVTRSSVSRQNESSRSKRGAAAQGACGGEDDGSLEAAGISAKEIKNVFTELRKGANHPLMLLNYFKGGGKMEEVVNVLHRTEHFGGQASKEMVAKEISTYSDFDLHQICSNYDSLRHLCLPEEALFTSAKMERLRTLLPELVSKGHRILLFSQWTRLLDLLEVLLSESMGLKFCRLDGSTPVVERKALIDRFGSDRSISVFLLSTRAGGLGINLTSADTVILHDVDFNPENDRQAEDRCHRIGQTKPVTIIKMVAEGTVDEDIYTMGERKKEVNKSVLDDTSSKEADASSTISGILKRAIQVHIKSSSR